MQTLGEIVIIHADRHMVKHFFCFRDLAVNGCDVLFSDDFWPEIEFICKPSKSFQRDLIPCNRLPYRFEGNLDQKLEEVLERIAIFRENSNIPWRFIS